MTCPHCGATAREQERFCPSCSRLIDSPLLKMRQELDAARGGTLRDRAPRAAQVPAPGLQLATSAAASSALVERARLKREKRARHAQRKAERRAALATPRLASSAPPPMPREFHTRAAHDSVPDSTLEQALRGQAADASAALERARQPQARQPQAQPRPPKAKRPKAASAPPAPDAGKETSGATAARRTSAITVLLLLNLATLWALYAAVSSLQSMPQGSIGRNAAELAQVVAYVVGGLVALASIGLWAVQPFGRALQRLVSVLWLPVFPFGTLFAFVALLYLGGRGVRLLFSGRGGSQLNATEAQLLAQSRKFAPLMAIVFFILGVMAWGSVVGVAAGLQPALREPGSISEVIQREIGGAPAEPANPLEAVLSDLHDYAIAQAAYAEGNAGYFDRTECLVSNACITDRQALATPLAARYLEAVRNGYEFRARLGPPPEERGAGVSATSVLSFAYLAVPVDEASGASGYCVEPGLTICRFDAGIPITAPPGECPAECERVR